MYSGTHDLWARGCSAYRPWSAQGFLKKCLRGCYLLWRQQMVSSCKLTCLWHRQCARVSTGTMLSPVMVVTASLTKQRVGGA